MRTCTELSFVPSRRALPRLSLLMALVAAAMACSSSPPLPAAEYFSVVEEELIRLDQATKDLTDRYALELDKEIELLVATREAESGEPADGVLDAIVDVARAKMQAIISAHTGQVDLFTERIGGLIPPDAVSSSHQELVASFATWASTAEATLLQLETAAGLGELAAALTASPYADAQLRVDQACRALIANAAGAGIELSCPGARVEMLAVAP